MATQTVQQNNQVPAAAMPVADPANGTLNGRRINTAAQLKDVAENCLQRQNRNVRILQALVEIVSIITAVAVGIIAGTLLSPVAGLLAIPAYFLASGLFVGLTENFRSRKLENVMAALASPDFIHFAEERQVALTRENVSNVHKAYLKVQDERLRNPQSQTV